MQEQQSDQYPIPSNQFRLEELQTFLGFEHNTLSGVNYYLWVRGAAENSQHFLFALELQFETGGRLLLSSGEGSEAISVISDDALIEIAKRLEQMHGHPVIQSMPRSNQGLWANITGTSLEEVQLSRGENNLFRNDALMLRFEEAHILVRLVEAGDGLEIREV
ncbi:MAG: hypothetical protein R3A50_16435 [Saprospiraceae bacterium]